MQADGEYHVGMRFLVLGEQARARAAVYSVARPAVESLAAVSVSAPRSRLDGNRYTEEIPELVLRTANVIEGNMSYS